MSGWLERPLADLLSEPLRNGRSVPTARDGFPVLRLTAIRNGSVDLGERKTGAWTASDARPYLVTAGDFMIARGNGSLALVGRGGLVRVEPDHVAFPDTMIRARPDRSRLVPEYLALVWESDRVRRQVERSARTSAGIYKVSQPSLSAVALPVPPIGEQRRIVAILEEHLSDLDDGVRSLRNAQARCRLLNRSVLLDLIREPAEWPPRWRPETVSAVGSVDLGRQRHPCWHHGPNMRPYLRVANVFEDRIDTSDVMEMHWPEDTFERFKLRPGQILLNEGQSPQYLGRPAMYRGDPADVAFTNSLLRFTAGPDALPEFALLVFRRHMHAGRFAKESRITTNIAHLSASRLKGVEFPVPSLAEQKDLVNLARERLGAVSRIEGSIQAQMRRADGLRRAVLAAAFSGRLSGHSSDTNVIEELAEEESA